MTDQPDEIQVPMVSGEGGAGRQLRMVRRRRLKAIA